MSDSAKHRSLRPEFSACLSALSRATTLRPVTYSYGMAFALAILPLGVICAVNIYAFFSSETWPFDRNGYILGRDFINYWTASILYHAGRLSEVFDLGLFHQMQQHLMGRDYPPHLWSYPPTALFVVLPFAGLPYLWAFASWITVTLAFYLFAAKRFGMTNLELAALVLAPSTIINFFAGQNGFLTAGLLIFGLALLDRRPLLAGVMFGLLSFKPQLGLLIPIALCAAQLWRPFIAAAVTSAALFVGSIVVFGWESWRAYLDVNAPAQSAMLHQAQGPFVQWMPTTFMSGRILGLNVPASYALQAIAAAAAIGGVIWVFRTTRNRHMQAATVMAGTALATPYLHAYDLTLLSVAILWTFRQGYRDGFFPGENVVLFAAWVLPILVFSVNAWGIPIGPVIMLCIFATLLVRANAGPS
jgi:alpha-1,2-mannosyltransferase